MQWRSLSAQNTVECKKLTIQIKFIVFDRDGALSKAISVSTFLIASKLMIRQSEFRRQNSVRM